MSATATQTRPASLTEVQHQVLSAAAGRPEGSLILPARLKGKAAQSLARALLDAGLVREIRAKGELPVWRKDADTGRSFTLVLTKIGRERVTQQPATNAEQQAQATSAVPLTAATALPRSGSKLAAIIALLGRDQGSSIAELMATTGWLPHTTRAALTGLRKRGYVLTREAGEGGSVYRIAPAPAAAA